MIRLALRFKIVREILLAIRNDQSDGAVAKMLDCDEYYQ